MSQAFSDSGPLVAALVTAVVTLAGAVVVLWRQNQALHKERTNDFKEAQRRTLEREDKVHRTVDKLESVLQAFGQSRFPPMPPPT